MSKIDNYKLQRYGYKAFAILEKRVVGEGKREGEVEWRAFKYPGGLAAAARGLLQLDIPENEMMAVHELIVAVRSAETNVIAALSGLLVERGEDTDE